MATRTAIRKTTRETFKDMTVDERILFKHSIAMGRDHWKDELRKRFRDGILVQIESGKPTNSKDVRNTRMKFDQAVEHYSHFIILGREWDCLMKENRVK